MASLKDIAAGCGVPESTLRVYRDEFADLVPTRGEGRRRRYEEAGAAVLRQIVRWKQEGWGSARIRDELQRQRRPQERARLRTTEERLDAIDARLQAQSGELAALRVEMGALRAEMRRLVETLQQQVPPTFEAALLDSGEE